MNSSKINRQEAERIIDDQNEVEDELELELEDIPSHIRDARLSELKAQAERLRAMKEGDHGSYTELLEEKQFLDLSTSAERCVVHFFHPDFRRCAIMDKHLQQLSGRYFETKFAKVNVDKAKFFVEKLKIRVLPAVLCFRDGIVTDRIVGFEELGNTDDFPTKKIEKRLGKAGVIEFNAESDSDEEEHGQKTKAQKTIFGAEPGANESDDDNDW